MTMDQLVSNAPLAPYPSQNFNQTAFWGPPLGGASVTATSATTKPGDASVQKHMVWIIIAAVVLGFAIWHWNYRRG